MGRDFVSESSGVMLWRKSEAAGSPVPALRKMREEPALSAVEGTGHPLCGCVSGFENPGHPPNDCLMSIVEEVEQFREATIFEAMHLNTAERNLGFHITSVNRPVFP